VLARASGDVFYKDTSYTS